jgi:hypothetical protein
LGLDKAIQLIDLPTNPNLMVNDDEVILIRKCTQNHIALITSKRIRILSDDLQNIVSEYQTSNIGLASVEQEIILIGVEGNKLMAFDANNLS